MKYTLGGYEEIFLKNTFLVVEEIVLNNIAITFLVVDEIVFKNIANTFLVVGTHETLSPSTRWQSSRISRFSARKYIEFREKKQ